MALSSWNALYTHIEQKFMRRRQWRQLHLLKVFVQHADPFGLSYPGEDLIKDLTGLGTTAQINENLQFLVDGEYLKIWDTWNPRRRVYDLDYQVSPWKMYIREEYQSYCERIWNTGERDYGLENAVVMKLNGQPASEPESEPTSVNQHQNQHHHPPNNASKKLTTGSANDYTNQAEGQQRKRRKPTAGKARATEKEPAHAGPPAPDKIDLRKYRSPLPPAQEDRAQDLTVVFHMKINQARALAANYDDELVATAAAAVLDAMNRGAVNNPAGLLTYMVKKGGINVQDKKLFGPKNTIADETARLEAYQE